MIVMPADHIIQDEPAFHQAIVKGVRLAETGYGYIRCGQSINGKAYQVAQFVEKPDLATAKQYLASGQFLWNGGIFAITASVVEKQRRIFEALPTRDASLPITVLFTIVKELGIRLAELNYDLAACYTANSRLQDYSCETICAVP